MTDSKADKSNAEVALESVLESVRQFFHLTPNHFCNFCRAMNFYHLKDCPGPLVLKTLGLIQSESEVDRHERF